MLRLSRPLGGAIPVTLTARAAAHGGAGLPRDPARLVAAAWDGGANCTLSNAPKELRGAAAVLAPYWQVGGCARKLARACAAAGAAAAPPAPAAAPRARFPGLRRARRWGTCARCRAATTAGMARPP
jgi:hypothetical protein